MNEDIKAIKYLECVVKRAHSSVNCRYKRVKIFPASDKEIVQETTTQNYSSRISLFPSNSKYSNIPIHVIRNKRFAKILAYCRRAWRQTFQMAI